MEMAGILGLASGLPGAFSVVFSFTALAVSTWLYFKRVGLEKEKTESSVHDLQIKSLIEQIELLSTELSSARIQISVIHTQNLELMAQLRTANSKINELESILSKSSDSSKSL